MAWHLAPDVSYASVGDDLVFLDIASDAYLCLPSGGGAIRRTSYGILVQDTDLASELAEAGLIEERAGAGGAGPPAPSPRSDLREATPPVPRLSERLAFANSIMANTGRYHGKSLRQMVGVVSSRGAGPNRFLSTAPDPAIVRRALVFERLLPWAPRQEACLYRSFMLLRFLGDLGRDASWVFGVRTRPFEAHCWIQAGDVVLNDNIDHVVSYAPILVT